MRIAASEPEFYEQLEQRGPGFSRCLRALVDSVADVGIAPDSPASLVLRWLASPDVEGRAGFVEKTGKAYFQSGAATAKRAGRLEVSERYLHSIADAVGGSIPRCERAVPEVVGPDGRAINLSAILDHAQTLALAVELG